MTDITIDTSGPHEERGGSPTAAAGVRLDYTGDLPTIRVVGRADSARASALDMTMRGLVAVGVRELVVDLTDAPDVAVLLPGLAKTRRDLLAQDGTLRVVGLAV